MADSKSSEKGGNSTSWTYNPDFTPAQNPNYDYKTQIVGTLNASAVTKDGSVPAYSAGAPKGEKSNG